MRMRAGLLTVYALVACLGCSGNSSDAGASVPEQCAQLGQAVCTANSNCAVETGQITGADQATYDANCTASYDQTANCGARTAALQNPSQCEADYSATPCSSYNPQSGLPVPKACVEVFK
jgi:hypothetical protein